MVEQHLAIAHRDHVVVEHTLVDHRRVLLGVDHAGLAQPVQARDGLAGLQGLPRRVARGRREAAVEGAAAEHEELHAGLAIALAETGVVGRAFVTELRHRRQRGVVGEVALVGEHRPSTRLVVGCSMLRWNLQLRLAAVKRTRPSAVSALGLTVQALAVHMLDAELQAASSGMASRAAFSITWASVPAKPRLRSAATLGRSCGRARPA